MGALSPVINREDIRAVSDYGSTNGQVFGVDPEYNQIRNVPVEPGAGSIVRTIPTGGASRSWDGNC